MATDFSYTNISHQPLLKPMALASLWRHRAAKELRRWQQWLGDNDLLSDATLATLQTTQSQLNKARFTIAIVAEVSRGKSELINSMLFAQHGKRIVPAGVGRTTMCPTEFFCDEDVPSYLELLPIDTRTQEVSLSELCNTPSAWQRFDLPNDDSDFLAQTLLKVCETQKVSLEKAQLLGLNDDAFIPSNDVVKTGVEVPMWRYARLNMHHPLLASGLAILDTPGLNALGHEPELTYAVLPDADAVIYMLSADSGVTRSDQLAWHQHLNHLPLHSKMAVLNKIDALNDGLRSPLEIRTDILQQMDRCAAALGLPKNQVFAVSARSGLNARMNKDDALLNQSRVPLLETSLTTQLLEKRQALLKSQVLEVLEKSYRMSTRDLKSLRLQSQTQLSELQTLNASSNPEQAVSAYERDTKKRFLQESTLSQNIHQTMALHESALLKLLSVETSKNEFELVLNSCQSSSANVIKQQLLAVMMALIKRIEAAVSEASKPMATAARALGKVDKLNGISPLPEGAQEVRDVKPLAFDEMLIELGQLAQTSAAQLPAMLLQSSAQRSKAAKTVMALDARCTQLLLEANRSCEQWLLQLNEPIHHALALHKALLAKRSDTLSRMQQAQQALSKNLSHLSEEIRSIDQRLRRLKVRCEQAALDITGDLASDQLRLNE
jgi:hypothetical protein